MKRVRITSYCRPDYLRQPDSVIVSELSKYLGLFIGEAFCVFTNASNDVPQTVEVLDLPKIRLWKLEHLGFDIVIID